MIGHRFLNLYKLYFKKIYDYMPKVIKRVLITVTDGNNSYYLLYFILSILTLRNKQLYIIMLLDFMRNEDIINVLKAIINNIKLLMTTLALGAMIVYCFTAVLLFYYSKQF